MRRPARKRSLTVGSNDGGVVKFNSLDLLDQVSMIFCDRV
jgi:hypothetical protein